MFRIVLRRILQRLWKNIVWCNEPKDTLEERIPGASNLGLSGN